MRLAAQMKGGYYPAPPEAVAYAASLLQAPQSSSFSILDPCAGAGDAIKHLADLLCCPPNLTYAIELDDGRADKLRAALPDAQVLTPASFFGCRASYNSFSFIWLNPPFDDAYAGHRVETRFLLHATDWLMPGGVMALVCPQEVVGEYSDVRSHFASHYQDCMVVPFPVDHRQYKEVIVFGRKRNKAQADESESACEAIHLPKGFIYQIPAGAGPKHFRKVEPTGPELQRLLVNSPLRTHLKAPSEVSLPSPPLALGIGHIALLLASGHLDGVVQPPGKAPHVVRGSSRKREYVSDVTETENENGTTTTKTTLSQKIELIVRTIDGKGHIRTFMEAGTDQEAKSTKA